MTTTANVEKLRQYKSRFSLIAEQIQNFALGTNSVEVVLKELHEDHLRYRQLSLL